MDVQEAAPALESDAPAPTRADSEAARKAMLEAETLTYDDEAPAPPPDAMELSLSDDGRADPELVAALSQPPQPVAPAAILMPGRTHQPRHTSPATGMPTASRPREVPPTAIRSGLAAPAARSPTPSTSNGEPCLLLPSAQQRMPRLDGWQPRRRVGASPSIPTSHRQAHAQGSSRLDPRVGSSRDVLSSRPQPAWRGAYSEEELRQIAMVGDPYQPKQPAGYMGTWHTRSRGGAPKFGGEPTKWNYVTGFWDVK